MLVFNNLVVLHADREELPVGVGLTGTVLHTGRLIATDNPQRDDRFDAGVDTPEGGTPGPLLCVPVRVRDKTLGVLRVFPEAGVSASARTGEILTSAISAAVRNVLMYRSLLDFLVVALAACDTPTQWGPDRISLADLVPHQAGNVSTQLIWPRHGVGLSRLKHGWVLAPGDAGDAGDAEHFEIGAAWSRLHLFAADTGATTLELDAWLEETVQARKPKLRLRLNGEILQEIALERGRQTYELTLSADALRRGRNDLELRLRPLALRATPGSGSRFHLYRLILHPGGSRALWAERPERIRVRTGARSPGERVIELPAPAFLDVVAEITAPARLEARVSADFPSSRGSRQVELYAELLDERGETHHLYRQGLGGGNRRLSLDLERWRGQLVRLRLGATGSGNGLVKLAGATLSGRSSLLRAEPGASKSKSQDPGPRLGRPDVVFILLDAARADAFGCYGGPRPTPALDDLAAEGTRFARALSAAPWTGQSVPSVFTGLYPDSVGIEHWSSRLPAATSTLAERMTAAGYRTVLWSQHPFYNRRGDLKRGFSEITSRPDRLRDTVPDPELFQAGDKPLFAFFHLLPPHTPYSPPEPFLGAYSSGYEGETPVDAFFLNSFPRRRDPAELGPEDRRYIRDRYLENAAFADSLVGRIVARLRDSGRYQDSLIVVLSDHGEAFLEHDRFMHGQRLYREFLHVPLIVKWPSRLIGFAPVIEDTVTLVDLLPTLLDGLGLATDGEHLQGISLLPAVFDRARTRRSIYSTTRTSTDPARPTHLRAALEVGEWKLVWDGATLETELYRLTDDPGELNDLSDQLPLQAMLLEQMLLMRRALHQKTLAGFGGESAVEALDAETEERLRALGYL